VCETFNNEREAIDDRYWNREIETIAPWELQKLQFGRLNEVIQRARRSKFYKKRLPDRLKSLEYVKDIPLTTKQDLRAGFPDGFLTVGLENVIRLHSSSGTTGRATVIYHTRRDIDCWTELVARSMYMTGVRRGDVFQNIMGYGLFTGGLGLHYGSERLGALTIPASSGNSKRQIRLMKDFGTTVIHITPSYALPLYSIFEEDGVNPRRDLNLRIAYLGAEPYSNENRKKIEDLYGIDAFKTAIFLR